MNAREHSAAPVDALDVGFDRDRTADLTVDAVIGVSGTVEVRARGRAVLLEAPLATCAVPRGARCNVASGPAT